MSYEDYEDLLGDDTFDYVEDTYIEADDLAEHAVPSPPPMNDDDDFDADLWQYDYWMDIDYASDGDEIRQRKLESRAVRAKKRKLGGHHLRVSSSKRRKVLPRPVRASGKARPMDELAPVIMMKRAADQRYEPQQMRVVDTRPLAAEALFKDWREKFQNAPMWDSKRPAAELEEVPDLPEDEDDEFTQDEDADDARALLEAAKANGELEEEEWEDEEEEDQGGGAMELDPEALKMAIQQNLAAAGINTKGMDEQKLMSLAMKMFSGGGESDDLLGEFTEQLLGGRKGGDDADEDDGEAEEETEDEQNGFAGWVQKQAEEKAAKKEKEKEKEKPDFPTPESSDGKPSASPPDKRVDQNKDTRDARGTKRKADSAVELPEAKPASRRRFDAPTASSKARAASGTAPAAAGASTRRGRKG